MFASRWALTALLFAIPALGHPPIATKYFERAAKDRTFPGDAWNEAVGGLRSLGSAAIPFLVDKLTEWDSEVRATAVLLCTELVPSVEPVLVDAFRSGLESDDFDPLFASIVGLEKLRKRAIPGSEQLAELVPDLMRVLRAPRWRREQGGDNVPVPLLAAAAHVAAHLDHSHPGLRELVAALHKQVMPGLNASQNGRWLQIRQLLQFGPGCRLRIAE